MDPYLFSIRARIYLELGSRRPRIKALEALQPALLKRNGIGQHMLGRVEADLGVGQFIGPAK